MSRQHYERYFNEVRDMFSQSLRDEMARSDAAQKDFRPHFHFVRQIDNFCGINALSADEKLGFTFNLANYTTNLNAIYWHFQLTNFEETLIELVRIIRELMLIADVNLPLFLSSDSKGANKLSYSKVSTEIERFMGVWTKSAVEEFRNASPGISFQKIKEQLLLEIKNERRWNISDRRRTYLSSLLRKVEALDAQNDLNCFELMDTVYSYCVNHLGSNKLIYNALYNTKEPTKAEKDHAKKLFKAILEGKPIPKAPQETATRDEWFNHFPYSASELKIYIEAGVEKLYISCSDKLTKNPTEKRRAEIMQQTATFRELKTAIACLENPDVRQVARDIKEGASLLINNPDDAFNIALLALYYVKIGGSREIFIWARKAELNVSNNVSGEVKKQQYLLDFERYVNYDVDAVNALLKPPQPQQALNPHAFLSVTPSRDDDTSPPPSGRSTRPGSPC